MLKSYQFQNLFQLIFFVSELKDLRDILVFANESQTCDSDIKIKLFFRCQARTREQKNHLKTLSRIGQH